MPWSCHVLQLVIIELSSVSLTTTTSSILLLPPLLHSASQNREIQLTLVEVMRSSEGAD